MRKGLAWVLLAAAVFLSGCANVQKMPWETDTAQAAPSPKSIFLLTATIKNTHKERFQPELQNIQVIRDDGTPQQEVLPFKMDSRGAYRGEQGDQPARYLIRLELAPGNYTLRGLVASARAFPVIGFFFVPVHAPLKAGGAGITYLGAIDASVRERQGEEFRAGPMIPLIDQAVAGASTGSFDVLISDQYDSDLALFRKVFAGLGQQPVGKAVLPPFDRAKAQAWWQAN